MKIAIAHPDQVGLEWDLFPTDYLTPEQIRSRIRRRAMEHPEDKIVTTNRTILDMVKLRHYTDLAFDLSYEDVFIWDSESGLLEPLLKRHTEEWLAQSKLGTLFERGLL